MYYVRIPDRYDNYRIWAPTSDGKLKYAGILVGGELFTYKEYCKLLALTDNMPWLPNQWITLPKSMVTWFFGSRRLVDPDNTGKHVEYEIVRQYYANKRSKRS